MDVKKGIVYLDTACMGLVPPPVLQAVREAVNSLENITSPATDITVDMHNCLERARISAAGVFHASPGDFAIIESTTHGLGLIAESIPLEGGDNILACDLEFFATTLCWKKRQEKDGLEIRRVHTRDGIIRARDFADRMDRHTKAVIVSSVQEINGFRADIRELRELTRKYNALLVVDGIQEAGALSVDLSELEADVYCCGGHKWLRTPFGAGLLYIDKKIVERIQPSFYGYFNALEPKGGWQDYLESPLRTPFDAIALATGTQKYETGGTANFLGALALGKNLEIISDTGIAGIEEQVLALHRYALEKLAQAGVNVFRPEDEKHFSGILSFNLPRGLPREKLLAAFLRERNIFVSLRYTSGVGGIRVSPHYYNTVDDIDRLAEAVKDFLKKG